MTPGQITLTRMPAGAASMRSELESATTAC